MVNLLLILFLSANSFAKVNSLFEWGLFLGHGNTADYPTSDEYRLRTIPVPYIRYRGEFLKSDDKDGTRLRLLSRENFDFDFSFGGSLPTEGDKNQARLGMPTLDWTLEAGPRLLYYFYRKPGVGLIRAGLPLRYSLATDFTRWAEVGYILAPTFQIDKYNFLTEDLDLYFILDFNYYSRGEAAYFFQVDSQFATQQRRNFEARAGYLGYDLALAAKYEWHKANFILGSRYSDYSESVNRTSDLHKTNVNWTFFVGLGWLFFESDERGYE